MGGGGLTFLLLLSALTLAKCESLTFTTAEEGLEQLDAKLTKLLQAVETKSAQQSGLLGNLTASIDRLSSLGIEDTGQQLTAIQSAIDQLTEDVSSIHEIKTQLTQLSNAVQDLAAKQTLPENVMELLQRILTSTEAFSDIAVVVSDTHDQVKHLRSGVLTLPERLTEQQRCNPEPKKQELEDFDTIAVVVDIYSEVPNPCWEINREHPLFSAVASAISTYESEQTCGTDLGYLGMSISGFTKTNKQKTLTICRDKYKTVQLTVLSTATGTIDSATLEMLKNIIAEEGLSPDTVTVAPPDTLETTFTTLRPTTDIPRLPKQKCQCTPPKFKPQKWNIFPRVAQNSGYNYVTNMNTMTNASPGRGRGTPYRDASREALIDAMKSDGLKSIGYVEIDQHETGYGCLIALFTSGNNDFHLLRRDSGGRWSHKKGSRPASDKDDNGQEIYDPKTAYFGSYRFQGYLLYCPNNIRIC